LIRAPWDNIWQDADNGLSFGWEPRVYFPTDKSLRDFGYIGSVRNYLKLRKTLIQDTLSITLMDAPIVHVYNRAGGSVTSPAASFETTSDPLTLTQANPFFENRIYLVGDLSLLDNRLSISVPVFYHVGFNRDYSPAGAGPNTRNSTTFSPYISGKTFHKIYAWPEVTYAIHPNVNIGVAWQTNNFLTNWDFTQFSAANAVENSAIQFVLRASL
jgi:hypothetical protein